MARAAAAALLSVIVTVVVMPVATALTADGTAPSSRTVTLADLPPQAREVHAQILQGGPFHYDRDGVVFGNREGLLPSKPRGYYHEYTVPTPGQRTRGARRIVCGGPPKAPDACYYTDDHYRSFRRIQP